MILKFNQYVIDIDIDKTRRFYQTAQKILHMDVIALDVVILKMQYSVGIGGGEYVFMKGAILQKGEEFYTDLLDVFNSIGNIQNEYNWLITDLENCIWVDEKQVFVNEKGFKDYVWISGEELTKIQTENHNFQWI